MPEEVTSIRIPIEIEDRTESGVRRIEQRIEARARRWSRMSMQAATGPFTTAGIPGMAGVAGIQDAQKRALAAERLAKREEQLSMRATARWERQRETRQRREYQSERQHGARMATLRAAQQRTYEREQVAASRRVERTTARLVAAGRASAVAGGPPSLAPLAATPARFGRGMTRVRETPEERRALYYAARDADRTARIGARAAAVEARRAERAYAAAGPVGRFGMAMAPVMRAASARVPALGAVSGAVGRVGGARGTLGAAARPVTSALGVVGAGLGMIPRGIGAAATGLFNIPNLMAAYAASNAAQWGILHPLQAAGRMQQAELGFGVMMKDKEAGKGLIQRILDWSMGTPFRFDTIRDQAQKLLGAEFNPEKIVPMIEAVSNMAAARGLGEEGVERALRVFIQMAAKDRVLTEELIQLNEIGIPAQQMLARGYGISQEELQDWITNRNRPASLVGKPQRGAISVLTEQMNLLAPGMLKELLQTLPGAAGWLGNFFENKLVLSWGQGLASAVQPRLVGLMTWLQGPGKQTAENFQKALFGVGAAGAEGVMGRLESLAKLLVGQMEGEGGLTGAAVRTNLWNWIKQNVPVVAGVEDAISAIRAFKWSDFTDLVGQKLTDFKDLLATKWAEFQSWIMNEMYPEIRTRFDAFVKGALERLDALNPRNWLSGGTGSSSGDILAAGVKGLALGGVPGMLSAMAKEGLRQEQERARGGGGSGGGGSGFGGPGAGAGGGLTVPQTQAYLQQYGFDAATIASACGPIAAAGIAQAFGLGVTPAGVLEMAPRFGWKAGPGMGGYGNFQKLLGGLGIPSSVVSQEDALAAIGQSVPIAVSTPGHYFLAQGMDAQKGIYVGNSGAMFGKEWMSLSDMRRYGKGDLTFIRPHGTMPTLGGVPAEYAQTVLTAASQYGLDPVVLARLLQMESNWNPGAVSPAGAWGLGQFMPGTAPGIASGLGVSVEALRANPALQIQGAAYYLDKMRDTFKGDMLLGLAAYNAGAGTVQKYGGIPPFDETRQYVQSITEGTGRAAGISITVNVTAGLGADGRAIGQQAADAVAAVLAEQLGVVGQNAPAVR